MRSAWLLIAVTLSALIAGCSSTVGTPTPIGNAPLNVDIVSRLLTLGDIEAVGGEPDGLDQDVRDWHAELEGAPRMEGIEAAYGIGFSEDTQDGSLALPALIVSIRQFVASQDAIAELETVLSGGRFRPMDEPIGERSAFLAEDIGTGTGVVFLSGRTLVSIESPPDFATQQALTGNQVLALAEIVERRL